MAVRPVVVVAEHTDRRHRKASHQTTEERHILRAVTDEVAGHHHQVRRFGLGQLDGGANELVRGQRADVQIAQVGDAQSVVGGIESHHRHRIAMQHWLARAAG